MLRLINDIVKPWEELNVLLVQRFAFQPDLSDVTRLASALAVSIKHQADLRGISRSVIDSASNENRIMSDVADAVKHGQLRDPSRNNRLDVVSWFEYSGAVPRLCRPRRSCCASRRRAGSGPTAISPRSPAGSASNSNDGQHESTSFVVNWRFANGPWRSIL